MGLQLSIQMQYIIKDILLLNSTFEETFTYILTSIIEITATNLAKIYYKQKKKKPERKEETNVDVVVNKVTKI